MLKALGGNRPEVGPGVFIAEGASVIGRARIGAGCSIWYNAVVRADLEEIAIGEGANVQDTCVLHVDAGFPMKIGSGVIVGHGAVLHGCTVGDNSIIGVGSIVLNGAVIGEGSILGAGSVVPEGKVIPPGSVAIGAPARVVRKLSKAEADDVRRRAALYGELAAAHAAAGRGTEG